MNDWHYAEGDQQKGPVSEEILKQMISSGQLSDTSKVWKQGMSDWVPANSLVEFSGLQATSVVGHNEDQINTPYQAPGSKVFAKVNWHYAEGNQQRGPVPEETIKEMISSGHLPETTKVWKPEMPDWVPANSLTEFSGIQVESSTVLAANQVNSPYQTPISGGTHSSTSIGPMPETYLWQSIAVTLCCCQIPGVVAIVFAAQVSSKYASGDLYGAQRASDMAKIWCIVGAGLWAVAIVLYILLVAVTGVT